MPKESTGFTARSLVFPIIQLLTVGTFISDILTDTDMIRSFGILGTQCRIIGDGNTDTGMILGEIRIIGEILGMILGDTTIWLITIGIHHTQDGIM